MNESAPLVELRGVSREFRPAHPLARWFAGGALPVVDPVHDVSMLLRPREVVGVLGPTGAGRRTLLRLAAGILPPTRGEVAMRRDAQGRAAVFRMVPRDNRLFDRRLTVRDHLDFFGAFEGMADRDRAERIREVLAFTQTTRWIHTRVGVLEPSVVRRVAIAAALLARPDALVLDDASVGLEPRARTELHELVQRCVDELGVGVLLATRDLAEAQYLCHRLICLERGRIVAEGDYLSVEPTLERMLRAPAMERAS